MRVQEVVQRTAEFFKKKGIGSARLDAELLLAEAMGWRRLDVFLKFDYPMSEAELEKCRALVTRRGQGEPMAYIRGKKEFYKTEFLISPGVLIPRPETESLVTKGVEFLFGRRFAQPIILDLGCGSGCIGLSILKEIPEARLVAVDFAAAAVEVTEKNARHLGLDSRVSVAKENIETLGAAGLRQLLASPPQLIVANPPYISPEDPEVENNVKAFEPHEALFSSDLGLAAIKAWSAIAKEVLARDGLFLMEIGWDQGPTVTKYLKEIFESGKIELFKDEAGHDRIVRVTDSRELESYG